MVREFYWNKRCENSLIMPFIRTAYVANGGTARESSSGENIYHFNAVRLRVVGQGSLKLAMFSLQDVTTELLADLPMSMRTNIQPNRLANFMDQRASLELKTVTINDYFRVNRIIIFSRETYSEYPQ